MNSSKLALLACLGIAAAGTSLAQSPPAAAPAQAPAPAPAASAPAVPPPPVAAKTADAMDGLASVYSDKLNGHKTASGQVFHQADLTGAHPSLPFGTKVKVTNKNNNKSVEVRINDRGPTQAGRVIDLSSAAAAKIGMKKNGTAPVTLEVVGEAPAKTAKKK
jgi:rare lipoprotein A